MHNMWKCIQEQEKLMTGHKRKQHGDDVSHFTFFCVESVVYQLLTYILKMWTEIFHHLHSMVLCDRVLEMTVINIWKCLLD